MKKILLSMVAMMCIAAGANAQKIGSGVMGKAELANGAANLVSTVVTAKANAPRKIKDDEKLVGYPGSETPVGYEGWPSVSDAQAVAVQFNDTEKINALDGYQVVGMRFIVLGNLAEEGDTAQAFVWLFGSDENLKGETSCDLIKGEYDLCTLDGKNLTIKYNDVYFDQPLSIAKGDLALRYGLIYTQNLDKNSQDAYPFIYGTTTEVNRGYCYLVYGTFSKNGGEGWYLNADEEYPNTPCIQLIVKDGNGATSVIGIKGSEEPVASQYYTLDGKQLSAPQKGLNIVRMSDGTTRKVVK